MSPILEKKGHEHLQQAGVPACLRRDEEDGVVVRQAVGVHGKMLHQLLRGLEALQLHQRPAQQTVAQSICQSEKNRNSRDPQGV